MVDVLLDGLKDKSNHSVLVDSQVSVWVVLFNVAVHPYFANTLTVDTDVLFGNGEAVLYDAAG
jgi:hypothetical protein